MVDYNYSNQVMHKHSYAYLTLLFNKVDHFYAKNSFRYVASSKYLFCIPSHHVVRLAYAKPRQMY
jgi:hypothetical protein